MKIQNALKSLDHFTRRLCKKQFEEVVGKRSNPIELTEATLLSGIDLFFLKGQKRDSKKGNPKTSQECRILVFHHP
jgi:hypothetical protein